MAVVTTSTPMASSWADIVKKSSAPETKDNQIIPAELECQMEDNTPSNLNAAAEAFFPSVMNANAVEFTPGFGLSEFGQTVEGWQTLGQRLGTAFSAAALEFVPATSHAIEFDTGPNVFAINPAYLCDDESDDDDDFSDDDEEQTSNESTADEECTEGDQESIARKPEPKSIESVVDEEGKDGKLDNTGLLTNDSDKDTSFNDASDGSLSLGTASDSEDGSVTSLGMWKVPPWRKAACQQAASDEDEALPATPPAPLTGRFQGPVRPPPGLSLPPWKLQKQVSSPEAATEVNTPTLKLPPWRQRARLIQP